MQWNVGPAKRDTFTFTLAQDSQLASEFHRRLLRSPAQSPQWYDGTARRRSAPTRCQARAVLAALCIFHISKQSVPTQRAPAMACASVRGTGPLPRGENTPIAPTRQPAGVAAIRHGARGGRTWAHLEGRACGTRRAAHQVSAERGGPRLPGGPIQTLPPIASPFPPSHGPRYSLRRCCSRTAALPAPPPAPAYRSVSLAKISSPYQIGAGRVPRDGIAVLADQGDRKPQPAAPEPTQQHSRHSRHSPQAPPASRCHAATLPAPGWAVLEDQGPAQEGRAKGR